MRAVAQLRRERQRVQLGHAAEREERGERRARAQAVYSNVLRARTVAKYGK